MSKAAEWAKKLDGRQYRDELTREEYKQAKADRVLIVYGASDDLTEFDGLMYDEAGAYDGATHHLRHTLKGWEIAGNEGEDFDKGKFPVKIKAEWCPEDLETSWRITSNVPGHAFTIKEDDDTYCIGLAIDEADMLANAEAPPP